MKAQTKERILRYLEVLKENEQRTVLEIPSLRMKPCGYKKAQDIPVPDETWTEFQRHEQVHGKDTHYWFYAELDTPACEEDRELFLQLTTGREGGWDATNPQGLLYLNGEIATGLDVNHRDYPLKPDTHYRILLYLYAGMTDAYIDVLLDLKSVDLRIRKMYYDLVVPYESAILYPEESYTSIRILKALELSCNLLDFRQMGSEEFYRSLATAGEKLRKEFYEKECGNSEAVVSYIGHTHIDVAWLWTLAQTREKAQRTFATMLHLMDRYPEFIFFTSQPQLLQYLKEEAPELYEKVKERVREGRFEVDGAMWLEADCNLTSGESLVRQILHGKRFIREEFGLESKILWLPDVFGYSAALPQIMKKSGVDQFVTSKISWNEEDKMPYDTFLWEGIDGTEVFTYFLTAQKKQEKPVNYTTYVGTVSPSMNLGTWERYQQKEYNDETIVTYGFGDGGGGTTAEMIEYERRLEYGIPGQPKAKISRAGDFLSRVEKNFRKSAEELRRMPRWTGELYLEFHRGTYTSMAKNKRNNRQCEFLLESAETLSVLEENLLNTVYPAERYHRNWETVLLNQFHDIIPGSSIFEVYEDSDRDYARVRNEVGETLRGALKNLAGPEGEKLLVYNPNGFPVTGYLKTAEGTFRYMENVPAFGLVTVSGQADAPQEKAFSVSREKIVTPFYELQFNEAMQIVSLYDRENDRQVFLPGERANVLRCYENQPHRYDNWELFRYYQLKYWDIEKVQEVIPFEDPETCGVRIIWQYGASTVEQVIRLYRRDRRIDFETEADWHEDHQILKVLFPMNVHASEATFEIQYGNVKRPTHRNTSWDQARFEVCAQKWVDISEEGYGVSLLNDCKYGHSAEGSLLTLSLIKTGTYPNPTADQGHHSFTYAILPHKGSYREGGTVREAYLLNRPLLSCPASKDTDHSLVSCDRENIVLECAKKADSGEGTVLRLYDTWDMRTEAKLRLGTPAREVWLCDLQEKPIRLLGSGSEVTVPVKNFEIVSLLIK